MTQMCEASRISLHAPSTAAAAASAKVGAPTLDDRTSAPTECTAAPSWQQKNARDRPVKTGAHSSRKEDSRAQASASRPSNPQENFLPTAAPDSPPPYSKSTTAENSLRASAESAKNSGRHRAITCFKCGKSGHVASACNSNAKPPRKCYACGGGGHMARACPTCAAQSKSQPSSSTSNAVASAVKGAGQVFTAAVINGIRIADALIDTGLAFSMLSTAMYGRLPNAPAIQPFTRAAPDVFGVGGARPRSEDTSTLPSSSTALPWTTRCWWLKASRFPVSLERTYFVPTARCSRSTKAYRCVCAHASATCAVNSTRIRLSTRHVRHSLHAQHPKQ